MYDRVLEVICGLDDLADDVAATHVLVLGNLVLDALPFHLPAFCDRYILCVGFLFNSFIKLIDHLIDTIFVLSVDEHLNDTAESDFSDTVFFKAGLFILLVLYHELLALAIQLFL